MRGKNQLWIVLCGVLEAIIAAIFLVMQNTDGPLTIAAWNGTVLFLGEITLAAGVCSIAAGLWRGASRERWPLVLHGLALGALGTIYCFFVRYRISIRTVALLIMLMAMSIGILEFARGWFLALAGAGLIGSAVTFSAFGFRWIQMLPGSHLDLLWLGFFFSFSAICMVGLALRPAQNPFTLR